MYFQWFMPNAPDTGQAFSAPTALTQTLLAARYARFVAAVYGPLAFLPLLRPDVLLVSAPVLAMGVLSTNPMLADIRYQYSALLYPIAFAAAIHAIKWLSGYRLGLSPQALRRGLLLAVCMGTVLSYVFRLSPLVQWNRASPARPRVWRW